MDDNKVIPFNIIDDIINFNKNKLDNLFTIDFDENSIYNKILYGYNIYTDNKHKPYNIDSSDLVESRNIYKRKNDFIQLFEKYYVVDLEKNTQEEDKTHFGGSSNYYDYDITTLLFYLEHISLYIFEEEEKEKEESPERLKIRKILEDIYKIIIIFFKKINYEIRYKPFERFHTFIDKRVLQLPENGTCWCAAAINCLILSETIRKIIIEKIDTDENKNKFNMFISFKQLFISSLDILKLNYNAKSEIFNTETFNPKNNPNMKLYISNFIKFLNNQNQNYLDNPIYENYLITGLFYFLLIKNKKLSIHDDNLLYLIGIFYNKTLIHGGKSSEFIKYILRDILHIDESKILYNDGLTSNNDATISNYNNNNNEIQMKMETAVIVMHKPGCHAICAFKCDSKYYLYDSQNYLFIYDWTKTQIFNNYVMVRMILYAQTDTHLPITKSSITTDLPVTHWSSTPRPITPITPRPVIVSYKITPKIKPTTPEVTEPKVQKMNKVNQTIINGGKKTKKQKTKKQKNKKTKKNIRIKKKYI